MGSCQSENSCETQNTYGPANGHREKEECTFAEDLLCLVKSAKGELLKEKMKRVLETRIGQKLDKVAEVAVDAFLAEMQQRMAQKHACDQYKENLIKAFTSHG